MPSAFWDWNKPMTRQDFLDYCSNTYNTVPDFPFDEDFQTAALRHVRNRKLYALVMHVPRRKFGLDSDEIVDVVNVKIPLDMYGAFDASDGVYPAYHMNKIHWVSILLQDAEDDVVGILTDASYKATKDKPKTKKGKR